MSCQQIPNDLANDQLKNSPCCSKENLHTAFISIISNAYGRTWRLIKKHPSWFPGVSTITGITTATLYSLVATVSLAATCVGIFTGVAASAIPSEKVARDLKRSSITWVSISHNFFSTSLRLALRGAIATIPILGNGTILLVDLYNNKSEEHLFSFDDVTFNSK